MRQSGGDDHPPNDVRELDRILRRVHFQPRASFHPELLGRMCRSERPALLASPSRRRWWPAGLVAGLVLALGALLLLSRHIVTVDRCCYDLDGGGEVDDGALIIAQRDGRVHRLSVYEDRDGSRTFTPADVVRLTRVGLPFPEESLRAGMTRIRHCCQDLDGGGPADDGLLVVATPPDRVHTAAIYELR